MITDTYSNHAYMRMQQRGISGTMINMVLEHGCSEFHRGCEIVFLDKQAFQKMCFVLKQSGKLSNKITNQLVDKLKKVYVVIKDGVVITTALKHQHFKRSRK